MQNRKRKIEHTMERLLASSQVSERNKILIQKFVNECYTNRLSDGRVSFYADRIWAMFNKGWIRNDLDKLTKDELKETVRLIESSNYKGNTKNACRITLRKLVQVAHNFDWTSREFPACVKFIRIGVAKEDVEVTPEEVLSEEETKRLIHSAENSRDRAMIAIHFETAARPDELLNIRLKDVKFDNNGAVVYLKGYKRKTPFPSRITFFLSLLSEWITNHPFREDEDSALWCSLTKKYKRPMGIAYYNKLLKSAARRAKITKRVIPYTLRKTGLTFRTKQGLSGVFFNVFAGWAKDSSQIRAYISLSEKDIDDEILLKNGVKKRDASATDKLSVSVCPRCFLSNPSGQDYCTRCHMPLTQEAINKETDARIREEKEMLKLITPEMVEKMIDNRVRELLKQKK